MTNPNAVEDAVKALSTMMRLKSGINEDGRKLMQKSFGFDKPKLPALQFNLLQDDSDWSEQEGFMHLFIGTVMALRNPRAHKIIKDDPEIALEFIALVSLLAKFIDKATATNMLRLQN